MHMKTRLHSDETCALTYQLAWTDSCLYVHMQSLQAHLFLTEVLSSFDIHAADRTVD